MINANKELLTKVNELKSWQHYKKTKPLWAKKLKEDISVNTLEGKIESHVGDYLCKGPTGDIWPQKEGSLFKKYDSTDETNSEGWQKFTPKPDASGVMAAQIDHKFSIKHSTWGTFKGNAGDYLVKNYDDKDIEFPADLWIVKKEIFEATYEKV